MEDPKEGNGKPLIGETREDYVYLARLSEQSERYEDMIRYMKQVAQINAELTVEERNLLSVAYKNVAGARRASWRMVSSIEQRRDSKSVEKHATHISQYRETIEKELTNICEDVLAVLDHHLIPAAQTAESKVFYHKMRGDYQRYMAEYLSGETRQKAITAAHEAYRLASDLAVSQLPSTHPIRLGLALNYSVFYYEILSETKNACSLAKRAFDDAIAELDNLPEESYKDSTLIMQLLRDNLALWTADSSSDIKEEPMEPAVNTTTATATATATTGVKS